MVVIECDHCGHQDPDEEKFLHLIKFKGEDPVIMHFCKRECLQEYLEANPRLIIR